MVRVDDSRNSVFQFVLISKIRQVLRLLTVLSSGQYVMNSVRGVECVRSPPRVTSVHLRPNGLMFIWSAPRSFSHVLTTNDPRSRLTSRQIVVSQGLVAFVSVTISSRSSPIQFNRLTSGTKE